MLIHKRCKLIKILITFEGLRNKLMVWTNTKPKSGIYTTTQKSFSLQIFCYIYMISFNATNREFFVKINPRIKKQKQSIQRNFQNDFWHGTVYATRCSGQNTGCLEEPYTSSTARLTIYIHQVCRRIRRSIGMAKGLYII